jgi:hypothetical protein
VKQLLWSVKALLLLIAVGVLVLWVASRGRALHLDVDWYRMLPQRADYHEYSFECENGWMVIGGSQQHNLGEGMIKIARDKANAHGDGRTWRAGSWESARGDPELPSAWGPFSWNIQNLDAYDSTTDLGYFAAPCWLVATATGAWPLTTIGLMIRRRVRRWRRERSGCCARCGYDLRATTAKRGPLFESCSECGTIPRDARLPGPGE